MSGGIKFTGTVGFWGVAGWVYRAALDSVCDSLTTIGGASELLAELKEESRPARAIQHVNLESWEIKKRLLFCDAIKKSYADLQRRGSFGSLDRDSFAMFSRALGDLKDMAKSEERQANQAVQTTAITPPPSATRVAPLSDF